MEWSDLDPFNKNGGLRSTLRRIDPFNTPNYQQTQYENPLTSAGDVNKIIAALGITAPQDTRASDKAAAFASLDEQGNQARAASDQTYMNRGSGAFRSGAARAGLDRINTQLAGAKANVGAQIDTNFHNQQRNFDIAKLQAALNLGQGRSAFGANQNSLGYQYNNLMPWQQVQSGVGTAANFGGNLVGLGMM